MEYFKEAFDPLITLNRKWAILNDAYWRINLLVHHQTSSGKEHGPCILCHLRNNHSNLSKGKNSEHFDKKDNG